MAHLLEIDLDKLLGSKKRDKVAENPYRALSPEGDRAYQAAAQSLPLAARIMALLPRMSGLRATDVGALPWNDVDWANAQLDYRCKKSGMRVQVPLDATMLELLREYRRTCPAETWLFPKGEGRTAGRSDVEEVVARVASMARIHRRVRPHDLRKTFATSQYYRNGADLLDLQRRLGHSDVNQTVSYVNTDAGWQRALQVMHSAA